MAAPLLAAAFTLLQGCEWLPVNEDWEAAPRHAPLRPVLVEVDSTAISRHCGENFGTYTHGCAVRDFARSQCIIYTRAKPAQWLVEHEKRHCDGWNHPAPHGIAARSGPLPPDPPGGGS